MCQNSVLTSQLAFVPFSNKELSLIRSLSFSNPGSVRASKLIMCAALSSGRNIVGFSWSWAVFLVFIFSYPHMYVLLTRGCVGVVVYKQEVELPLSLFSYLYFLCPCGWKLSSDNLQHSDQLVTFISQLWFICNYLSQLFAISTLGFSQILRFERYSLRILNFSC